MISPFLGGWVGGRGSAQCAKECPSGGVKCLQEAAISLCSTSERGNLWPGVGKGVFSTGREVSFFCPVFILTAGWCRGARASRGRCFA